MRFRYVRALLADLLLLGVRSGRILSVIALLALIAAGLFLLASTAVLPAAVYAFL